MTAAIFGSARRLLGGMVVVAAMSVTVAAGAAAQGNTGKVAFNTGADLSHAYLFRGILQERSGAILQPYMDMTVSLYEADQGFNSATVTIGQWNSLHSGASGAGGPAEHVAMWYESDVFAGFGLGVDNWDFGVTYTSYLSPNNTFGTVKELSLSLVIDDSSLMRFPLSPHVLMALELSGQADGGGSEGVYVELGVEPALDLPDSVVALSAPVTLGFSLSDYYELEPGVDHRYGFFDIGLAASLPIPVSDAYGAWGLSAGVHLMSLGKTLKAFNEDKGFTIVGTLGFSIGY